MKVANVLFGPPSNERDLGRMLGSFFSSSGVHIVCGGTTAELAASFLGRSLEIDLRYPDSGLPPIGHIEDVDLVTEGVVTMRCVLERAKTALDLGLCPAAFDPYGQGAGIPVHVPCGPSCNLDCGRFLVHDGACLIIQHLFCHADCINLFVGCASNPASESAGIGRGLRLSMSQELQLLLSRIGKKVASRYF